MDSVFVDINEASKEIMSFIGTKEYENIVSTIQNDAKSGFLTGLSVAMCLIMSKCHKYILHDTEDNKKEASEEA